LSISVSAFLAASLGDWPWSTPVMKRVVIGLGAFSTLPHAGMSGVVPPLAAAAAETEPNALPLGWS
jgi:hypothetical protein